ncbi:pentapeptide repeat-containing protein [Streptomyces lydicamycinicus]|uniref:pentapeptide repeat-containing protein n=1 Tax=Streptomyces lydicamycinicus TaxID=1546107 RepID=UPI0020364D8C|nr:pentapeptide repeat-containing protein [Streptomyces lydicamycinicus]URZ99515.1 pentapeptide repeat-containing protein [Streptomyces lydicamycinicus]
MTGPGQFAGKLLFASTGSDSAVYLTVFEVKGSGGKRIPVPGMAAKQATSAERTTLYRGGDGDTRIQLAGRWWIRADEGTGWLMLTEDGHDAAAFVLSGPVTGTTWKVRTAEEGTQAVTYSVDPLAPLLTTTDDAPGVFAPQIVTAGLQEIQRTKSAAEADLRQVFLGGADLSGVDLGKADLTSSDLTGANLSSATLSHATLASTTLTGTRCDGTLLDDADLTGAMLEAVSWPTLRSAARVILAQSHARGAALGSAAGSGPGPAPGGRHLLDCTGANLSGADLRSATLASCDLTGAHLSGTLISNARLAGSVLDKADLSEVVAVGADLSKASLRDVNGPGANLTHADLSGADLSNAQLGAKAFLFTLDSVTAQQLDDAKYAPDAVVTAFAKHGITISPHDEVVCVLKGARWRIENYTLRLHDGGSGIDVLTDQVRPAVLRGAVCEGTQATAANLAGADLHGIRWFGTGATVDHVDFDGAVLTGGYLQGIRLTQSYLSGTDLSDCVLIQAQLPSCHATPGDGQRPFSLAGALLHGADFRDTTLRSALLVDAAVATSRGVPLFTLPETAQACLDAGDLHALAEAFTKVGQPLGDDADTRKVQARLLDNSKDPNQAAPRIYRVTILPTELRVFDDSTARFLFKLPAADAKYLNAPIAGSELIAAFRQQNHTLAAGAPISAENYWEINTGTVAVQPRQAAYPTMRVFTGSGGLPVYGCVLVRLRDHPQQPEVAFAATVALDTALDADSIGPSGYARSQVDAGLLTWEEFLTPPA